MLLITVAAGSFEPAATASGHGRQPLPASGGGTHKLTLLTGDVVHVEEVGDERRAVTVEPGDGRDDVGFHHMEVDDGLAIVPLDALPHLGSGQLDEALFNIDTLIEEGHHDAATDGVPIIVGYEDSLGASGVDAASALQGTRSATPLDSINGVALDVDKGRAEQFWESVGGEAPPTAQGQASLDTAVERIWLDRTFEATLDESAGQIGAPDAWEMGLDGEGVTVAVLDTGVDGEHLDLAGQVVEERNFSTSSDARDRVGHGTHVAATIAGTGAGSQGARAGVAPGADLLSGKVLGDDGTGSSSAIIKGMQWAVDAGADIVNMSLGGAPSDGTDPLSMAVNQLTEDSGSLFVVSAGNSGPEASTIASPGSADAALTVGAVDREDAVASFSSRGPRQGDLAIKPDITGPGVGIVAARASGTSMGSPVNERYTAASGTSMAAPHVAGAAAILLQDHPDWAAGELKDGLASTAMGPDGHSVYEQGGGRVDIARALEHGIYATGTLHLGTFADADDQGEVSAEVSYVNTAADDVELDLDLSLESQSGDPASEGAVRVEQETVSVPAGGSAAVEIVVDLEELERGVLTGQLTASSQDAELRTTLGLIKEAPTHTVTFTGIGPDGQSASLLPLTVRGEDPRFDHVGDLLDCCVQELELAEGTYYVFAQVAHADERGEASYAIVNPALEVTEDAEVRLDAREANEIVIETPESAEPTDATSFYAYRELGARSVANGVMKFPSTERVHVTPTEPVADGSFEFSSRWQLAPEMLTAEVKGERAIDVDLRYLARSPVLEGRRTHPLVSVGQGRPRDYEGVSVEDAIALVSPSEPPAYDQLAETAAEAGAAMAVFIPPGGYSHWSQWSPNGPRLPTMAALVPRPQGERLLALLEEGSARLRLTGSTDQPHLYDIMQVSQGRVPEQIVHTVDKSNSATLEARYHNFGEGEWAAEQRFGWRPWMGAAINQVQRRVKPGQAREEVVSAEGTLWQHRVRHELPWSSFSPLTGGLTHSPRTYEAGERGVEQWHRSVVRPALPPGADGPAAYRRGDVMTLRIPEFADASPSHYGRAGDTGLGQAPDQVAAELYRDDELVAEDSAAWGEYEAVPEPAQYRLELSVERDQPEWQFSPRTETTWSFASQRPEGEQELLPLLEVDYEVDVDLGNRAASGRTAPLHLTVGHQQGLEASEVTRVAAWSSVDGGDTWEPLRVVDQGKGRFRALVGHPPLAETDGYVSLRVEAQDESGNSIRQTVERAYGLTDKGGHPAGSR